MNMKLIVAGLVGFLAVALAAFGAHGLPATLPDIQRNAYMTGGQFHLAHALLLAALALGPRSARLAWSYGAILLGTAIFCGVLYAYALTGNGRIAMFAPVGGLTLMIGWLLLAAAGLGGGPKREA
ncbi:MAG: DUF423 domain-containing protein [Parvularculaceae bacterium]